MRGPLAPWLWDRDGGFIRRLNAIWRRGADFVIAPIIGLMLIASQPLAPQNFQTPTLANQTSLADTLRSESGITLDKLSARFPQASSLNGRGDPFRIAVPIENATIRGGLAPATVQGLAQTDQRTDIAQLGPIVGAAVLVPPQPPSGTLSCSGGTHTVVGGKDVYTFTSSGTLTCTGSGTVNYLIIGGGAGGGLNDGGGGGAGDYVPGTSVPLSAGSYTITVGPGGLGAVGPSTSIATNGSPSSLGAVATAIGGGFGGSNFGAAAGSGASGGGGSNGLVGGSATGINGHAGGTGGGSPTFFGGGGGGCALAGGAPTAGTGCSNSISGSAVTYAIGGTGAALGGAAPSAPAANRGIGGDGAAQIGNGAPGGTGIVIVQVN